MTIITSNYFALITPRPYSNTLNKTFRPINWPNGIINTEKELIPNTAKEFIPNSEKKVILNRAMELDPNTEKKPTPDTEIKSLPHKPFDYKKYFHQTQEPLRSPQKVLDAMRKLQETSPLVPTVPTAPTDSTMKVKPVINAESLESVKRRALPASFLGSTPRNTLAYSDKLSDLLRGIKPAQPETPPANTLLKSILKVKPIPAPRHSLKPIAAPRLKSVNFKENTSPSLLSDNISTPFDNMISAAEKIHKSLLKTINLLSDPNDSLKPIAAPRLKTVKFDTTPSPSSRSDNISIPWDNMIAVAEKVRISLLNSINILSVENKKIGMTSYLPHIE